MDLTVPAKPDKSATSDEKIDWLMSCMDATIKSMGHEPRTAEGIEGKGLLGEVASIIVIKSEAQQVMTTRRSMLVGLVSGVTGTMAALGTAIGILKALGYLKP